MAWRARGRLRTGDSSSDSSSSDEDDHILTADRYSKLQLPHGLQSRSMRIRALQELKACITLAYKQADKRAQAAIHTDCMVAITTWQADSRLACRQAIEDLVKAAERVLPQQKRSQLRSELKRMQLSAKRSERKHATSGPGQGADSDTEGDGAEEMSDVVVFGHLPNSLAELVLQQLDAASLARAACVCSEWRGLVEDGQLWAKWAEVLYPKEARALPAPVTSGAHFSALVAANPRRMQPLTAVRVLIGDQLLWLDAAAREELARRPSRRGGRVLFSPTLDKVVAWAQGRRVKVTEGGGSSSGGSSCSDSGGESESEGQGQSRQQLRLWARLSVHEHSSSGQPREHKPP